MTTPETDRGWLVGSVILLTLLLVGMVPLPASAQDVGASWLPWLGCWEAADGAEESPMLCFRPLEDGQGVELVTWSGGEVTSTEAIQADGLPRQTEREGCVGQEQAEFAPNGGRVYLKADYVCEDGAKRVATGLMAMLNPMEWVDVKVLHTAGQRVPWTLRYRLARASKIEEAGMENVVAPRAMAVKGARVAASRKITVDDIVEASNKVDPEAVEALIVERGDPFRVNADMLLALSDAGVPESVIDLVVAVSFPDRYAVKPGSVQEVPGEVGRAAYPAGYYGRPYGRGFFGPFYDPYYYGYGGYGYSAFGYGGYGYGGYGYGGYGGYYRPTAVVISPRSGSSQRGRIVKGQGYRRSGGSSYGGSSGSTRSAPSSGGISSSGGASRGSSSGSTGRRAKPRGGGGGGF